MRPVPVGRRERKKAATRQALADTALELFLERGFDQVSVREIAEAADVSTTTLFKHFPSKEALVFDDEDDHETALVACVRDRPTGRSIPDALRDCLLRVRRRFEDDPRHERFLAMIESAPTLRDYGDQRWLRHQTALTTAIAEQAGRPADDPHCAALAHLALRTRRLARDHPEPITVINAAFDLLDRGWTALEHG
jgi:AcrR family transcriptional regulator